MDNTLFFITFLAKSEAKRLEQLLYRNLRILHRQRQTLLREVEHIEDYWLRAAILATVNGINHLDNDFTLVYHSYLAVQSYDGQLALHQHSVIHRNVVMPTQLLSWRNDIFHRHQFGTTLRIVRQIISIPTLAGA